MKKNFGKLCMGGVLLFSLSMSLTSCDPYLDDVLGKWSRPTPVTPTVNPDVTPEPPANPMLAVPLTLEVTTVGTIVVENSKSGMQYSLNGGARTDVPNGGAINNSDLNVGDKVEFYGTASSYYNTNIKGGSAEVKVYGNIMSLLYEDFATNYTTLPADDTFRALFKDNTKLTDASGLLLPATTLRTWCYRDMFSGCKGLTTVPEKLLPAESLASNCYQQMFYNCVALTTAPELPAENLAPNCYDMMFDLCYALTTAPALPAKILAPNCYQYMFAGCKALTATPKLPAESLVTECYFMMFYGCTSLTTAYVKAAYTTTNNECSNMFDGCTKTGGTFYSVDAATANTWITTFNTSNPTYLQGWTGAAYPTE